MIARHHFRAEHVGSFVRPGRLLDAVRAHRSGHLDAGALRAIQEDCIREVVAFQDEVGLPSVTDGEFRRRVWSSGVTDALAGMGVRDEGAITFKRDGGDVFTPASPYAEGRLSRARPIVVDDYRFLASLAPRGTPKVTMASPAVMHFFLGDRSFDRSVYADRDAYFADLTAAYREEIAELAAAGCSYVQLDDTALPCNCDPAAREAIRARGEDPDELTRSYVRAINESISTRTDDMIVGLHMCRGNLKGMWLGEGGYEPIAERLFNELDVDVFFMEYDTERAGDFRPLRHLPPGKSAVLGLVSTKTPELESARALVRRIEEASRFAPLEQLALSPQCGFSSGGGGGQVVSADDTRRKLALVVEVAREVWG